MTKNQLSPVDFFNFYGDINLVFANDKSVIKISDTKFSYPVVGNLNATIANPTFVLSKNNLISVERENNFGFEPGAQISKFMLLTAVRFKGIYQNAESFVRYSIMEFDSPYIRVGTDWFKIIVSANRWGGENKKIKRWKKETIQDDCGKNILSISKKFEDFIVHPDNKNYHGEIGNCYNLFSSFSHKEKEGVVHELDIPFSLKVLKHIFGEHFELGIKYMKILYDNPDQMLPILVLLSEERGNGKTTFNDWLHMLFGDNVVNVTPRSLSSEFNSTYATKNILLFEEAMVEKSEGMETVKALTTAKTITVRDLYTTAYTSPFFGKIIFCTNKVLDFMRIEKEETRFWIRKINPIVGKKNTDIDKKLFKEIPAFLKFLSQQPAIDFTRDRLVFTPEEIKTEHLSVVKSESKSSMQKEIEILVQDFFNNSEKEFFLATSKDIKEKWFYKDNKISISYIRRVLANDLKLEATKLQRYSPFDEDLLNSTIGCPFVFNRENKIIHEIDF